jgi:hypothetical protein
MREEEEVTCLILINAIQIQIQLLQVFFRISDFFQELFFTVPLFKPRYCIGVSKCAL